MWGFNSRLSDCEELVGELGIPLTL